MGTVSNLELVRSGRPVALIVEDQATSRLILEELLRQVNPEIEVKAFADAASALLWAESEVADIVLIDYRLPGGVDGVEAVRTLRARSHYDHVPIVMVTVYGDTQEIRHEAFDAGVNDLFSKPYDMYEALGRIRNLLRLRLSGRRGGEDGETRH